MAEFYLSRFLNDSIKDSFNSLLSRKKISGGKNNIHNSKSKLNISLFIRFLELYYIDYAFDSLK